MHTKVEKKAAKHPVILFPRKNFVKNFRLVCVKKLFSIAFCQHVAKHAQLTKFVKFL